MIRSLRPPYTAMLLFVVTVGVYYASILDVYINQSVINIEDQALLDSFSSSGLKISDIFASSGKYFRPVTFISFFIDQSLWGDIPFGYRLTNLLYHSINVVLLYFTTLLLLNASSRKREISFLAALIFALHPLAVESVSWISGRTDPLATLWSLMAIIFYLLSKLQGRWYLLPFSFLFIAASVFSKETGLATPIIIASMELFYCRSLGYSRWRYSLPIFGLFIIAIPSYLILRSIMLGGNDLGLGLIRSEFAEKGISALVLFLASYGFYFKKFLYPFPLNIAINEINTPFYAICGFFILSGFVILLFFKNMRRYHFLLFWAILVLGPAALISFTDIAWTPWAERYVYSSSVPLSIICSMSFFKFSEIQNAAYKKNAIISITIILLFFCISTIQRSLILNSNAAVWKDSYAKSPRFIQAAVGYASSLASDGKIEEAEAVLNEATKLEGSKHVIYHTLGKIYHIKRDYEKAEMLYNKALAEATNDKRLITMGPTLRKSILMSLSDLERTRAVTSADKKERKAHYLNSIAKLGEAYGEIASPFIFYQIAKIYLTIKEYEKAAEYLNKFIKDGKGNSYRNAAIKLLNNIELGVVSPI